MPVRARRDWGRFLSLPFSADSPHAQLADMVAVHLRGMIIGATVLATALGMLQR